MKRGASVRGGLCGRRAPARGVGSGSGGLLEGALPREAFRSGCSNAWLLGFRRNVSFAVEFPRGSVLVLN